MRKTIIAGLLAASLVPTLAQAQYSPRERHELRNDRRDVREERRDLNRAYRNGDPRQIRNERGDLRDARREFREDRRDNWGPNDWRGYRDQNRDLYRGGNWRSDYRYQAFRPGYRLQPGYYGTRYVIADPWRYRLARPGYNQRWVRHYNDVLLVDVTSGIIRNVIRGFYS